MNKYTYEFYNTCPNDKERIEYCLVVESDEVIMCERIVEACVLMDSLYHETIADNLFTEFGGKQVITAIHQGVKVETFRG